MGLKGWQCIFYPSNRSPTRPPGQSKKSPVQKQAVSKPTISDERDDYGDDFDELEEIINTSKIAVNKQHIKTINSLNAYVFLW